MVFLQLKIEQYDFLFLYNNRKYCYFIGWAQIYTDLLP